MNVLNSIFSLLNIYKNYVHICVQQAEMVNIKAILPFANMCTRGAEGLICSFSEIYEGLLNGGLSAAYWGSFSVASHIK